MTQGKKHKKLRKWLLIILLILSVGAIGSAAYLSDYYPAATPAMAVLEEPSASVSIQNLEDRIVFAPEHPQAGLIFYPGGKVQCEAYVPLLEACAENGMLCILLRMPGNLAVLDMDAAQGLKDAYPEITRWYLGGHSLGGAVAAEYLADHSQEYTGLILLAAYSAKDLSNTDLQVLSIYGSEDGVLNREKYEACRANLPSDAQERIIEGGCHSYFGDYGAQAGDGTPTITREEQQEQTVAAITALTTSSD